MHTAKRNTIAALMLAALVGCGGSDSSSNDDQPKYESSFDAPSGDLKTKMDQIEINDSADPSNVLCQTPEEATTVFETDDFIVSFGQQSDAPYYAQDLAYAAQMSQVALNELIEVTKLDKEKDLHLDGSNKWFVCFENSKQGRGEGYINGARVNPEAFDEDALKLTRHELFHTIQAELLGEKEAYSHLPFWFQEATAEYFAHAEVQANEPRSLLEQFTADIAEVTWEDDPAETSYDVLSYKQDNAISDQTNYDNKLFDIYVTSLKYLVDRGLDTDEILTLISSSSSDTSDASRDAFHAAMAALESDGKIEFPTGYTYQDLRTVQGFTALVLDDWLGDSEYSAEFTSVNDSVMIGELYLFNEVGDEYTATVADDQTQYFYTIDSIPDGTYEIYAGDTADENIYGPITQEVVNGELGPVDFTDQELCTTGKCADEEDTDYSDSFTGVSDNVTIVELVLVDANEKEYSATVNSAQTKYTYEAGSIPDGEYNIYGIDATDTNAYGPLVQSVIDGELGPVDFTGQPVCTTGPCAADDDYYTGDFVAVSDEVTIGSLYIIADDGKEYSATVNEDQSQYTYTDSIPDGDYNVYAIDTADVYVYGPIEQTVTNGELGEVDFSGQPLCTTGMCAEDD